MSKRSNSKYIQWKKVPADRYVMFHIYGRQAKYEECDPNRFCACLKCNKVYSLNKESKLYKAMKIENKKYCILEEYQCPTCGYWLSFMAMTLVDSDDESENERTSTWIDKEFSKNQKGKIFAIENLIQIENEKQIRDHLSNIKNNFNEAIFSFYDDDEWLKYL